MRACLRSPKPAGSVGFSKTCAPDFTALWLDRFFGMASELKLPQAGFVSYHHGGEYCEGNQLRTVFYYILTAIALAFIAMFFVSEHSKHVQIGYELTQLRRERDGLREKGRKLDFQISKLAAQNALADAARQLGLNLEPPDGGEPQKGRASH